MKIEKSILYFMISLPILHVWDLLYIYNFINPNIWTLLNSATTLIAIYFVSRLFNDYKYESNFLKIIFPVFIIYGFIVVFRGWSFNYSNIKSNIQTDYIFWPFIIPLFVFFDKSIDRLAQVFKCFYYLGIIFLIVTAIMPSLILNRSTAEIFIHPLAFGSSFLLMNARYLSKKKVIICFLVTLVALLSFVYLARRNAVLTYSGFMIAAGFLYIKNISLLRIIQMIPILAGLIFLSFFAGNVIPSSLTTRLSDRLSEDSRSIVFEAFFDGIKNNKIFGKGMSGTYYCPFNETVTDDGATFAAIEYRNVIENGYLQLMLTGGILHIILFSLIMLPAVYLGIFKSANNLSRACGAIVFLWLIDMAVFGLPRLYLQYIFVWICVGICYKTSFRQMKEEEIYNAFEKIDLA